MPSDRDEDLTRKRLQACSLTVRLFSQSRSDKMAEAAESTSSLSPLLTLVGWWFLPSFLSKILLRVIYTLLPSFQPRQPALPPRPPNLPANAPIPVDLETHQAFQKANAKAQQHQRWAQIFVIASYLVYGVVSLYFTQHGANHYARLGLHSDAFGSSISEFSDAGSATGLAARGGTYLDEAGLKAHWRRLARVAHPDKHVPTAGLAGVQADREKVLFERRFVQMREAYEVLQDETRRWAYERSVLVMWSSSFLSDADNVEQVWTGSFGVEGRRDRARIRDEGSGPDAWGLHRIRRHTVPHRALSSEPDRLVRA